MLGEQLAKRGSGGEALRPMLGRTLADVQERLIYRCQAFIKEAVIGYTPTAEVRVWGGGAEGAVCACVRGCVRNIV